MTKSTDTSADIDGGDYTRVVHRGLRWGVWVLLIVMAVLAFGCGVDTLVVEPGTPMRTLAPVTIEKAAVYDAKRQVWVRMNGPQTVPAGWFFVAPPTTQQIDVRR